MSCSRYPVMGVNHLHRPVTKLGWLQRVAAGPKLALAIGVVLVLVWLPAAQWRWLFGVGGVLGLLVLVGQISGRLLVKRLLLLEPFVVGVAALMLFQPHGGAKFALALAKANLCLVTTLLLSQTTRFTEMLAVLQRLRVPWLFVTTLTLMHRYLFVLADESERMRRARASRTFTAGRKFQWQTLSSVVGLLFVRASERAERIYDAMCARGWK